MTKYNPQVMGEMLNAAFNNSELMRLAFDIDLNLPDEISHLPKSGKVIGIVKYAVSRGADDKIISYVQENNAHQYEEFKSKLTGESSSQPAQPSTQPPPAGNQTTINTGGGAAFMGNVTAGGDVVAGNVTHNHNSQDPELKEILSGITEVMEELANKEPIQNITNNQNFTFGDNATISGTLNAVQAETIEESFNTVAASNSADDLKSLLTSFLDEVKALPTKGNIDQDDLDDIVKNGDILVTQASSDEPDEDYVGLSMAKLKKAAAHIGELAVPIMAIAGKIVAALGFG